MNTCENCGNNYEKAFEIKMNGKSHTFDCFECAIHVLAPACSHCETPVIGHGVESQGQIFCCAHCAKEMGHTAVRDHA